MKKSRHIHSWHFVVTLKGVPAGLQIACRYGSQLSFGYCLKNQRRI